MGTMTGRSCVVTGAARGIGRAIGEALLDEGADVCFADIDGDGAGEVAADNTQRARDHGGKVMAASLDVTDRGQVREIPVPDGGHGLLDGGSEDLLTHEPVVTVPSLRHVLLGQRDVCGDGAVEKVEWVALEDCSHRRGYEVQSPEHGLTQRDVCGGAPRGGRLREKEEPGEGPALPDIR